MSKQISNAKDKHWEAFAESCLRIVLCPYREACLVDFKKVDASVEPQGGFIGSHYAKSRVLIIGQNPGGGKLAKAGLSDEDRKYYSMVDIFRHKKTTSAFSSLMNYLEKSFIQKWPIFRRFDLERNWGINISDIALINAVHCRTIDDKTPSRRIVQRCFKEHTSKQIDILKPRLIICFGKKAYDLLTKLYANSAAPIKYILHPSGQYTNQHPQKQSQLISEIAEILSDETQEKPPSTISKKMYVKKTPSLDKKQTKRRRNSMSDESIFSTRERIKEYLVGLGFQEKDTESFDWSAKHTSLGIVNFHDRGGRLGSNLLSSKMRNNCGFSPTERKGFSQEERKAIYKKYFHDKPYYEHIKYGNGMKFHFRKSGTDYISLSLGLGFDRLKGILDYEFSGA